PDQFGLPESSPISKLHPVNARARLDSLARDGRWREAGDSLRTWFRQSTEGLGRADTVQLLAQLDTLILLMDGATPERVDDADVLLAPGAVLDFNPQLAEGVGYRIFAATPAEITITEADPIAVQQAFCWTAFSASDLLGRYRAPAFRALQQRIKTALALWERYNESGRSQYPWELWLNGLGGDALDIHPPRRQFILFHPWVGIEATGLDDARLDDLGSVVRSTVVPVDLLGFVRYDQTYTRYWGASVTLALGEDRTRGGISLHLSNGISFGPTWSRVGAPDGLLFSIDFYDRLAGIPATQQAVVEKLRNAATAALGGSGGMP